MMERKSRLPSDISLALTTAIQSVSILPLQLSSEKIVTKQNCLKSFKLLYVFPLTEWEIYLAFAECKDRMWAQLLLFNEHRKLFPGG
jgi:hypothetical protein